MAGAFLKPQILIETIDKHVDRPGYTANRATLGKASKDILEEIKDMGTDLTF